MIVIFIYCQANFYLFDYWNTWV